jgi:hypothetical protein
MRLFDGCAIVTDTAWVRDSVAVARFLMPCPVRMFAQQDIALAVEWLEGLPHGSTSSHRLLPEDGVIIFEVREALRATDFDALAATADAWIETRGQLNGLVVHARHFPGWENALGMTRHMRFVKDHHCRIARIALVADSKLMEWAPRLGAHFVAAEVTTFGYDELDQAVAWASGRERGATSPPPLR